MGYYNGCKLSFYALMIVLSICSVFTSYLSLWNVWIALTSAVVNTIITALVFVYFPFDNSVIVFFVRLPAVCTATIFSWIYFISLNPVHRHYNLGFCVLSLILLSITSPCIIRI